MKMQLAPNPLATRSWSTTAVAGCLCSSALVASANVPDGAWLLLNDYGMQRVIVGAAVGAGAAAASHRFLANGTVKITVKGRTHRGTWRIARDELCVAAHEDASQDECYEVQQRGAQLRFLQDGYVILHGRAGGASERR